MGRRSRFKDRNRATTAHATAASPAPVTGTATIDPRDYAYDVIAHLARSSFAALSDPRRRRLRQGTGDYHCDYNTADDLRAISRWLEYHSGSYGGALGNWSQWLIGEGPTWTPTTKDTDWNRACAALIAEDLAEGRHDVTGRHTWGKWGKLLATSIVRDGAMGVYHTATGPAALIEAERVTDIDTDRLGRITKYDVCEIRRGFIDRSTVEPVSPAMFDWCAVITRTSQYFGLPMLFSSLDDHDGIRDLWKAEIASSAESSRTYMVIEEKDGGLPGGMTIPQVLGQANNSQAIDGAGAGHRGATPAGWVRTPDGVIMGLPKGLTGKPHSPERPNLDVPEFSKQVLRVACMLLLPYELLFGDQADISYSNGRSIRTLGNGLLTCFRKDYLHKPFTRIVRALIHGHILAGRLPVPKDPDRFAWKRGQWDWPMIPEHDRIKERQADTIDLGNGTASLKDINGEEWQQTLEQRAAEFAKAAELVARHNAAHPNQPITIHAIIGDPSRTASLALAVGVDGGDARKPNEVDPTPTGTPTKAEPAVSPA